MKFFFKVVFINLFFLSSCETDFDLNAPYETVPVVYGLLDQSLDTQIIKINKSYLGNTNNVAFASINDCTQFNFIIALLEEYNQSNNLTRVDTLREMYVSNLDEGIFYEGSQKIY